MNKIIILGSGASPGVPSLSKGYGLCNPDNPKNNRLRTSTYIKYKGAKFLIDTSPDLRQQLLTNNIKDLDAVLYTHIHGDHIHGIDYLRELNRITGSPIDIYADKATMKQIKKSFDYLIVSPKENEGIGSFKPGIVPHIIKANYPFYVKGVKITPLKLLGHFGSIGYSFDNGEIVFISDFKELASSVFKQITIPPKVMIMPVTTNKEHVYHASLKKVMEYYNIIKPEKLIINHMSTNCDYDAIKEQTPDNVYPAYDNMEIEVK